MFQHNHYVTVLRSYHVAKCTDVDEGDEGASS